MAIRAGMQAIVDAASLQLGASTLLTNEQIESILDKHKKYLKQERLLTEASFITNTYKYYNYYSDYKYIESGTPFRLFDNVGSAIITGFTADYLLGRFVFDNDQINAVRYFDGVAYDFHAAVAECWRLIQAKTAHMYDFSLEDRKFSRSQWFDHCSTMAAYHANLATFSSHSSLHLPIGRSDLC